MLLKLTAGNFSEKFFKVFYEKIKIAQQEIKASVTVNTVEITNKAGDEKDTIVKDLGKENRRIKSMKFYVNVIDYRYV